MPSTPKRVLILISLLLLAPGHAEQKNSAFLPYKALLNEPLTIKPISLVHYPHEEELIRQSLALDISAKERSILGHWLISFVDKNGNFDAIFPFFILVMHRLRKRLSETSERNRNANIAEEFNSMRTTTQPHFCQRRNGALELYWSAQYSH